MIVSGARHKLASTSRSISALLPRLSQTIPQTTVATGLLYRQQQQRWESSSTSAIVFKQHRHRRRFPPLPSLPVPTAEEAVSNILYNAPESIKEPHQRRVLNCLVQNEPGVLSRVSGILAARGFNIESLVVARTEVHDLSRMTLVVRGQETTVEQARRQLEDMVPVWAVIDYTGAKLIERELLLVKVSTLGPEQEMERQRKIRLHEMQGLEESESDGIPSPDPAAVLRETHNNLRALSELAELFKGRVVDVSSTSVVLELSAKSDRVNAFLRLVQPFGILEAARSGVMAMPRAPILGDGLEAVESEQSDTKVDATMLPPG